MDDVNTNGLMSTARKYLIRHAQLVAEFAMQEAEDALQSPAGDTVGGSAPTFSDNLDPMKYFLRTGFHLQLRRRRACRMIRGLFATPETAPRNVEPRARPQRAHQVRYPLFHVIWRKFQRLGRI